MQMGRPPRNRYNKPTAPRDSEMQYAQLSHVKMAYEVYGDETLPPVLMIMGLGMSYHAWPKELLSMLQRKGLRLILADSRDSGASTHFSDIPDVPSVPMAIGRAILRLPVNAPYTLEDMALDYAELLDTLDIKRAHIIGASLGGMIAQVLTTIRPSKVNSLTSIMSASGNPRTGFGKVKAVYSLMMHPSDPTDVRQLESHYAYMFRKLKSPNYSYEPEVMQKMISEVARGGFDAEASERQLLAILASGDRSEQLTRITAPSLIIHGEDDPLLPYAAGKELTDLIPNSALKLFKNMGHDLPPCYLEEMADAIASHIWSAEN